MNTKTILRSLLIPMVFFVVNTLTLLISFITPIEAQENRAMDGDVAVCKIKVNATTHTLSPDQLGAFDMLSNIAPGQTVPIEVYYPGGKAGEKVILSIEDGGTFPGDKNVVKVLPLNSEKKIDFQLPGVIE